MNSLVLQTRSAGQEQLPGLWFMAAGTVSVAATSSVPGPQLPGHGIQQYAQLLMPIDPQITQIEVMDAN